MPTHAEKRLVPYSADEMYGLIADVGRYPEFLPWCAAARVRATRPLPEGEKPDRDAPQPTDIDAEKLDVSEKDVTVLTGDVELSRGEQWLGRPNSFFDGRSALEVMLQGGVADILRVRQYLDAQRGG